MKRRRLRVKYDNIFICFSIVFIGSLFLLYSTRFIYFFVTEHKKTSVSSKTFSETLIAEGKDLLKDGNKYIYYGKNPNNYVYYSGIMFRIVNIENGYIKLVTDEPITSLVMSKDGDYTTSYVNMWMNEIDNEELTGIFSSYLVDPSKYLVNTKTCIDVLDDYNTKKCKKYNSDYLVGTLSIDEYMNAYSNNSYLNTSDYFWLSNTNSNGNFWYVFNEGGLSSNSKTEVTYHSFGVKPTITLNKNVSLLSGSGTKDDPYIIEKNENKILLNKYVGSYVSYAGFKWRIIGKDDKKVKLALSSNLELNGEEVLKLYDLEGSKYYNSNFYNYLNNSFYVKLTDTDYIIPTEWYDGEYNSDYNYDYRNIYSHSAKEAVGTISIGDMFIYDTDNVFLMTPSGKETLYSIQNNKIYIDHMSTKLNVRPVIYIDGMLNVAGAGTILEPLTIEGELE